MVEKKRPSTRRVTPYGEDPMRKRSVRLSKRQRDYLLEVGEGNLSLGARRVIERFEAYLSTLSSEDRERVLKSRKSKRSKTKVKAVRERGRPALSAEKIATAQGMFSVEGRKPKEIAASLGIHMSTFYKYVDVRKKKK